jgi:uncharacterized cupin superfamily protein
MILRKTQLVTNRESGTETTRGGSPDSIRYSDEGGLTQFGAYVQTLQPGARSSDRHWHEKEDEFLYMLSGEVTVIENDGAHALQPGDVACWPGGMANAHHVVNQSDAPCTYLIVGTRLDRDITRYPDSGQIQYDEGGTWRICRADGTLIREGTK